MWSLFLDFDCKMELTSNGSQHHGKYTPSLHSIRQRISSCKHRDHGKFAKVPDPPTSLKFIPSTSSSSTRKGNRSLFEENDDDSEEINDYNHSFPLHLTTTALITVHAGAGPPPKLQRVLSDGFGGFGPYSEELLSLLKCFKEF